MDLGLTSLHSEWLVCTGKIRLQASHLPPLRTGSPWEGQSPQGWLGPRYQIIGKDRKQKGMTSLLMTYVYLKSIHRELDEMVMMLPFSFKLLWSYE